MFGLKERFDVAKREALATAERVQQAVLTEENKEKLERLVKKVGDIVDELVEDPTDETLDLTYITDRFVAMAFPCEPRSRKHAHRKVNDIRAVARHLKRHHDGRFMVLNVSEESYDYGYFEDQVLEFRFPGHPAPPLSMIFRICASVESWVLADASNVIAVHCLTGRGRTSVVLACCMTWLGLFETTMDALAYIARRKKEEVERLTIPSQRRYAQYFTNVMDCVAPRGPVVLKRAIMSSAPDFGVTKKGCCPYLQFFKDGKLARTASRWETEDELDYDAPTWAETGPLIFPIDLVVSGDILVRCRHLDDQGNRISMFRAALHAGYAPLGVLRLAKSQLDGACSDSRFPQDFFLDLIFAPAPQSVQEDEILHQGFWQQLKARKIKLQDRRVSVDDEPVFAIGADPAPAPTPGTSTDELLERLAQAVFDDDDDAQDPDDDDDKPPPEDNLIDLTPSPEQPQELVVPPPPEQQQPIDLVPPPPEQQQQLVAPPPEQQQQQQPPEQSPATSTTNFDIDDFENYLNELAPPPS